MYDLVIVGGGLLAWQQGLPPAKKDYLRVFSSAKMDPSTKRAVKGLCLPVERYLNNWVLRSKALILLTAFAI